MFIACPSSLRRSFRRSPKHLPQSLFSHPSLHPARNLSSPLPHIPSPTTPRSPSLSPSSKPLSLPLSPSLSLSPSLPVSLSPSLPRSLATPPSFSLRAPWACRVPRTCCPCLQRTLRLSHTPWRSWGARACLASTPTHCSRVRECPAWLAPGHVTPQCLAPRSRGCCLHTHVHAHTHAHAHAHTVRRTHIHTVPCQRRRTAPPALWRAGSRPPPLGLGPNSSPVHAHTPPPPPPVCLLLAQVTASAWAPWRC
jgi:hypothetical protein